MVKEALAVLMDIIRDVNAPHMARVKAVAELLDRAGGKPASSELIERIEGVEQMILDVRNTMGLDQQ
jgi:hypothetical protein